MKIITLILMGWLVLWNVSNHYETSCCKGQPFYLEDEYGREYQNSCYSQLVACWETVVTEKSKLFDTKQEAFDFVETAKSQPQTGYPAATLSDFKILEVD